MRISNSHGHFRKRRRGITLTFVSVMIMHLEFCALQVPADTASAVVGVDAVEACFCNKESHKKARTTKRENVNSKRYVG